MPQQRMRTRSCEEVGHVRACPVPTGTFNLNMKGPDTSRSRTNPAVCPDLPYHPCCPAPTHIQEG